MTFPENWYWIVAGDEGRYWSSASGEYVDNLPDGAGVTRIATEAELTDVLRVYDLPGPVVTADQVDAERERRIALPLGVTLSVGAITINMDAHAQRNIQGLASVGQYLVATSSSDTTAFRDYDNTSHDLTPADLVAMGLQVSQRIQAVYAASWAIKAMEVMPVDLVADVWW